MKRTDDEPPGNYSNRQRSKWGGIVKPIFGQSIEGYSNSDYSNSCSDSLNSNSHCAEETSDENENGKLFRRNKLKQEIENGSTRSQPESEAAPTRNSNGSRGPQTRAHKRNREHIRKLQERNRRLREAAELAKSVGTRLKEKRRKNFNLNFAGANKSLASKRNQQVHNLVTEHRKASKMNIRNSKSKKKMKQRRTRQKSKHQARNRQTVCDHKRSEHTSQQSFDKTILREFSSPREKQQQLQLCGSNDNTVRKISLKKYDVEDQRLSPEVDRANFSLKYRDANSYSRENRKAGEVENVVDSQTHDYYRSRIVSVSSDSSIEDKAIQIQIETFEDGLNEMWGRKGESSEEMDIGMDDDEDESTPSSTHHENIASEQRSSLKKAISNLSNTERSKQTEKLIFGNTPKKENNLGILQGAITKSNDLRNVLIKVVNSMDFVPMLALLNVLTSSQDDIDSNQFREYLKKMLPVPTLPPEAFTFVEQYTKLDLDCHHVNGKMRNSSEISSSHKESKSSKSHVNITDDEEYSESFSESASCIESSTKNRSSSLFKSLTLKIAKAPAQLALDTLMDDATAFPRNSLVSNRRHTTQPKIANGDFTKVVMDNSHEKIIQSQQVII